MFTTRYDLATLRSVFENGSQVESNISDLFPIETSDIRIRNNLFRNIFLDLFRMNSHNITSQIQPLMAPLMPLLLVHLEPIGFNW